MADASPRSDFQPHGTTAGGAPLRVYLLVTELDPGGAERIVYHLATGLPRSRCRVRVGALRGGGAVQGWLEARGVPVFDARIRSARRPLGAAAGLARLVADLRAFRPDVLHTHLFHANVSGRLAARLAGVGTTVSTVHIVERRWRPLHHLLEKLTESLIAAEISVSLATARFRRQEVGIRPGKIVVIPNGVDLARAGPPSSREPDRPTVLAIGRLDRQKGLDLLVDAAALLRQRVPRLRVVIAGEGPERARLQAQVARLRLEPVVELVGHREEIAGLLRDCHLLAMPSRWEGFGLVAVEAQAAGRPVVAAAVDSLPDLVADGVTGLLVPSEDVPALVAALETLLRDPGRRRALGDQGPGHARRHTLGGMVSRHEELYRQVTRRAR